VIPGDRSVCLQNIRAVTQERGGIGQTGIFPGQQRGGNIVIETLAQFQTGNERNCFKIEFHIVTPFQMRKYHDTDSLRCKQSGLVSPDQWRYNSSMSIREDYPDQKRYKECVRDIGRLLQKASRLFQIMERDHIARTGYTTSQSYLLELLLHRKDLRAMDVARMMNQDKSSVSRLIKNLVRDGLIAGEPAADDRRSRILTLTSRGRTEAEKSEKLRREYYSSIIEQLPGGHVREIMNAAETLVNALE
jgi:DNA-binding MarR family transcriptional regulator